MTTYKNPRAFKNALTDRIKKRAKERGVLFNRYRQLVQRTSLIPSRQHSTFGPRTQSLSEFRNRQQGGTPSMKRCARQMIWSGVT